MIGRTIKTLSLSLVFTGLVTSVVAQEALPRCHVYIDQSGWIASDVDRLIKVRFDSSNLCDDTLAGYVCFSYFESREGCTKDDVSLLELFKKDARRSGQLID